MNKIDILHIIPSLDPKTGGPIADIQALIPLLQKAGFSNEVASSSISDFRFVQNDEVPVHEFQAFDNCYHFSLDLFLWGLKNLRRFRIIIIHGLWQFPSLCFLLWLLFLRGHRVSLPKVYIKPHGMLDPWFQKSPSRKFKAFRNFLFWLFIESHAIRLCDGLLYGSKKEAQLAKTTFPFFRPRSSILVGYSLCKIPPKVLSKEKEFRRTYLRNYAKPFLLFLSRIDPKKGLPILIEAYSNLRNRGLELPLLVIAGPGRDSSYKEFIKFLLKSNLPQVDYKFLGPLYGNNKWTALHACSAFVLPSHQENFGIAVVEALACNKPVLISNKINISHDIRKFGGGIVFNDNTSGVLKAILLMSKLTKNFNNTELKRFFKTKPLLAYRKLINPKNVIKKFRLILGNS